MEFQKLVNNLSKINNNESWKKFKEILKKRFFIVLNLMNKDNLEEGNIYILSYKDGVCSTWIDKDNLGICLRLMRGTVIRFENAKFVIDKLLLQRGAEVLTGFLKKQGINDTQDMNRDFFKFDNNQQTVINIFMKGGTINGTLSFKVDGSLLAVSVYGINTSQGIFYKKYIETYGDDFNKAILYLCNKLSLPFIVVLSSQKTIMLSLEDIEAMTITALQCDLDKGYLVKGQKIIILSIKNNYFY
jgi:hypothetical protein